MNTASKAIKVRNDDSSDPALTLNLVQSAKAKRKRRKSKVFRQGSLDEMSLVSF